MKLKQKTKQEKFNLITFILAVIVTSIIMCIFIGQKEGWHEDEIFSYGSSNYRYDNVFQRFGDKDAFNKTIDQVIMGDSVGETLKKGADFVKDQTEFFKKYDENLATEKPIWKTSEQAKEYMTVSSDEIFSYWSVYYNQARDVHPPLFYMLVHTISAICLNQFSKYMIFTLLLCFFIASCFVIRKIMKLFKSDYLSGAVVLLYGLSMGAISTVMFQRMYMMLTFFILLYLYLTLKIVKNNYEIDKKTKWQLFWTTLLGFLTQYNFCIYAVWVALIMFITMLKNKKYESVKRYVKLHIGAAITGILVFPLCISHMFFSYRGINGTTDNTHYLEKLNEYIQLFFYSFSIPKILGYILILALAILLIWKITKSKRKDILLILTLPVISFIPAAVELAPFISVRYVMCLLPIIAICIALLLKSIAKNIYIKYEKRNNNIIENVKYRTLKNNAGLIITVILTIIISVNGFITSQPEFLVKGYKDRIELAEKYKQTKLVYIGDPEFPHLKDMEEFLRYEDFLILNTNELKYLKNNTGLKGEKQFILEIKVWLPDTDKLLKQALKYTNATKHELLIEDNESRIYLVSL